MPTITRTIKVTTDENGGYTTSEVYNPPGFWDYNVEIRARLLSPEGVRINGTLEITAANNSTSNASKSFSAQTGETVDLGKWTLDGGDNTLRVNGQTEPAQGNTELEIEVSASL